MMRRLSSFSMGPLAALAVVLNSSAVFGASLTFHTEAPIPGPYDVYNFIGASRDGLNVNDDNGLDGPLNDDFTYVANDRPRQGQTFITPGANITQTFRVDALWLRMVGYTDNGTMPEPGYNGTDEDFSAGGEFTVRVFNPTFPGLSIRDVETYALTGAEPNNPAVNGLVTNDNGAGYWMKFALSTPPRLSEGELFAFDIASTATANRRFEWLGTRENVFGGFAGGEAFNGDGSTTHALAGDRVFLVELELVPEPHGFALAALVSLAGGSVFQCKARGRRELQR
jgi:hypothetical protein